MVRITKRSDQGTPNPSRMAFYVKVYRFLVEKQFTSIAYNYEQNLVREHKRLLLLGLIRTYLVPGTSQA